MADDWRSESFRRKVIAQIEEAVRVSATPMSKSSNEMENHVFQKANTREEYLAFVARLILHVKDFNNQRKDRGQQQQQQQAMQQVAMASGMVPQSMATGMPQQSGIQDPINALQNMAMSGTGSLMQGQQQGMMMGNQSVQLQQQQQQQQQQQVRQQLLQQQMMQQRGQNVQQTQRPQLTRQDAFIVTSAQAVQPVAQPVQVSTTTATSSQINFQQPVTVQTAQVPKQSPYVISSSQQGFPQSSPQVTTTSSNQSNQPVTIPSPIPVSTGQMIHSPVTSMTSPSPQSGQVPSPPSKNITLGDPSPSSLSTPGSVGTVASPASQSADERAYMEKLKQLSKYIEPLRRMIKKTEEDRTKDPELRKKDITKMKNLLDILTNPHKRVHMQTLIKCEQAMLTFGHKAPPVTTAGAMMPPTLHVATGSHMCQPLIDAVAAHITSPTFNHTLQRTYGPAISTLFGTPIRAPCHPAKKMKMEEKHIIPDIIQGELARLDRRFKVRLDPVHHKSSSAIHLIINLEDKNLPSVPPILVTLPEDYPESSPECATSGKDYESTPFLKAILTALSTYLFEMPGQFSLTSLLDMWEMSVRKACVPSV